MELPRGGRADRPVCAAQGSITAHASPAMPATGHRAFFHLPDNSYVFWTYSLGTYQKIFEIMGFEVTDIRKDKFHGAKSFTEDKGAMGDRVAIVARRRKPS